MRTSTVVTVLLSMGILAGSPFRTMFAVGAQAPAHGCATITAANSDECVRLNQIQLLGTHNSYHIAPEAPVLALLGAKARDIDYTHRPLVEQLSRLGIRKFELDVFADPEGGRYAAPAAFRMTAGLSPIDTAALREPGFKVIHSQDVDYRSTCLTLRRCLAVIRDWSRGNPVHVPIMVMIEAKDAPPRDPSAGFVTPLPIGAVELRALDEEIRSVFDSNHVITPDRVRGAHRTLAEAVQSGGWPTLRASRGRVLFALDNTGAHRDDYLRGNPSLEGRMLFVSSEPGEPSAAFIKMNDVLDGGEAAIRERVRRGFLIRTRADIPTAEARSGSPTRRDAAFRSGAHYVSTDYPEASPFGSGYIARLPGAERLPARCNPVNAPAGCRDQWLEPPPDARR